MTWKSFIELAKRRITGGNPSATAVWDEELKAYAKQLFNARLNTSYFQTVLPTGETTPDGYVLAVYTDIEVEKWQKKSRAKLPAYPVRLPRNMGVYAIADNDDEECQYIPIPAGQSGFIKKQGLMSDLLGQVGYEVKDGYAVFTKEIEGPVQMHLVVLEFDKYSETDILPVPAELFNSVLEEVVKFYMDTPAPDKVVDSNVEPSKQAK